MNIVHRHHGVSSPKAEHLPTSPSVPVDLASPQPTRLRHAARDLSGRCSLYLRTRGINTGALNK